VLAACSSKSEPDDNGGSATTTTSSSSAGTTSTSSGSGSCSVAMFSSSSSSSTSSGADADTWNNYAECFFQVYCVSCHQPGGEASEQNFNDYSAVKPVTSTIRCGVAPTLQSGCPTNGFPPPLQFPIYNATMSNPKPDDATRLRIINWINAGAPEG
jgi:hypothetical protein